MPAAAGTLSTDSNPPDAPGGALDIGAPEVDVVDGRDVPSRDGGVVDGTGSPPAGVGRRRAPSAGRTVVEYAGLALVAILLASLIRSFLGLAFYIPSESMLPALKVNDRVVVSRLSYHLHAPHRGDIVVFQNPDYVADDSPNIVERVVRSVFEVVGARQPEDKNLIKRVVGLPGETIAIHDNAIWIDAKKLNEPYLKAFYARGGLLDWEGQPEYTQKIPAGEYWMMGDNRDNSHDSRFFHTIKRNAMVGRAFVRVWPFSRLGGL